MHRGIPSPCPMTPGERRICDNFQWESSQMHSDIPKPVPTTYTATGRGAFVTTPNGSCHKLAVASRLTCGLAK